MTFVAGTREHAYIKKLTMQAGNQTPSCCHTHECRFKSLGITIYLRAGLSFTMGRAVYLHDIHIRISASRALPLVPVSSLPECFRRQCATHWGCDRIKDMIRADSSASYTAHETRVVHHESAGTPLTVHLTASRLHRWRCHRLASASRSAFAPWIQGHDGWGRPPPLVTAESGRVPSPRTQPPPMQPASAAHPGTTSKNVLPAASTRAQQTRMCGRRHHCHRPWESGSPCPKSLCAHHGVQPL